MTERELALATLALVDEAPCLGKQAEMVCLVKQWLRRKALPPPFDTAPSNADNTNGK